MTEKLATTTTKETDETAVLDPEVIDAGQVAPSAETEATAETNLHDAQERLGRLLDTDEVPAETAETESPAPRNLLEARQQLSDLLDEFDPQPADTEETEETGETEEIEEDETEETPEKKKRVKKMLRKMGGWAVTTLEAQGIIPQRGRWHKRNGFTGFIAKSYVYAKQQKANRVAGFLSPEANAQLNGETSPDDDHEEDEEKARLHRRIGRGALTAAHRTVTAPKSAYRTYKAIKNVKS